MATVNWSLQHKRDTAANWTANNPTLLAGQLGIETDGLTTTPKFKIGDGVTAWNTLPYFYGGSASAQDLNNVLTVGNTTSGQDIVLTDDDKLHVGSTAGRYIGYDTNLIQIGLGIVNTNSNDHIILQDGGGIHVDTTFLELPQLTASRVIATDANNRLSALTGSGFLTLNAGVISYDTNTYQPLDSDLTSWAGVTRASGFDTFVATPSSANLSSLLTDKTGTGVNVFGTSPTFTTDITTPLIIGGSAVGSTIKYKGTSGNGTSTVAAHQFLVGNNGATTAAQIFNSGQVSIGNYASPTNLRLVTIGQDSGYVSIGSLVGATTQGAIYINKATPSSTNYSMTADAATTVFNSVDSLAFKISAIDRLLIRGATTSGVNPNFELTLPANTGQTASTESPSLRINGASKTWNSGNITTQRWNYFTANTAAFASASTITNSYGLYVEAATAGSNASITNNWSAGFAGAVSVSEGTASMKIGNATDGTGSPSIFYNQTTYTLANAALTGGQFSTILNSNTNVLVRISNSTQMSITASLLTFSDSVNIAFNATTGTKIGTATTQKLSFWNATPIVQPTTAVTAATFAANTSGIANDTATFDGYTIGQVVKALRNIGLLA